MNFSELILDWYDKNKRVLPWRSSKNPYKIWVSEIILQQTRVAQGISYYNRFINSFPDLKSLAQSNEKEVLLKWQGLGYYSRARNLLHSAKYIYKNLNLKFPRSYDKIIKLKGVGDYTASAISSICFNEKKAVLDGNVFRILSRIFEIDSPINLSSSRKIFKQKADFLIAEKRYGDYNQAIMDFGSLICKPKNPLCSACVVSKLCKSFKNDTVTKFPVKTSKNRIKTIYYEYIVFENNNKKMIVKINHGIWKNLFQFPSYTSEKKQSKNKIIQFFLNKYKLRELNISLYNDKFIEHKLSHLKIKSRFWKAEGNINLEGQIFTDIFKDYPMSKLMHNFVEKYIKIH